MTRYAFQMMVWSNNRDIRLGVMKALAVLSLLWGFSSLNAQQEQNGPLDFSCSTFPADLSESDLVARYGQENVTTAPVRELMTLPWKARSCFRNWKTPAWRLPGTM